MDDLILRFRNGRPYFRFVLTDLISYISLNENKNGICLKEDLSGDERLLEFIYQFHHFVLDGLAKETDFLKKEFPTEETIDEMYAASSRNIYNFLKDESGSFYFEFASKLNNLEKPRLK